MIWWRRTSVLFFFFFAIIDFIILWSCLFWSNSVRTCVQSCRILSIFFLFLLMIKVNVFSFLLWVVHSGHSFKVDSSQYLLTRTDFLALFIIFFSATSLGIITWAMGGSCCCWLLTSFIEILSALLLFLSWRLPQTNFLRISVSMSVFF